MKKFILLSLLTGLLLASCDNKQQEAAYNALQMSKDSLQNVLNARDKEANEYSAVINEIDQNLENIKHAQDYITLNQGETSQSVQDRINENINLINKLLEDNKAKIASLEKKTKQIAGLQGTISALKKQMEEKEYEIAGLRNLLAEKDMKIQELDQAIASLTEDKKVLSIEKKLVENVAVEQDDVLNTAFYFFGTAKELKAKGIDVKKASVNKSAFTQIDVREVTSIDLKAKSGEVMSTHPSGSYKINVVNKKATLVIINPNDFWSMSKYLIVKTKQ
jgi:chromosome segregation ATPase